MSQHEHQRPRNRATDAAASEHELAPGKRTLTEAELAPLLQKLAAARRDQRSTTATETASGDPWQGLDEISFPPGSTAETFRSVLDQMRFAGTGQKPASGAGAKKQPVDELLFIGMGANADEEIAALARQANLVTVTNGEHSDEQSENGQTFDLTNDTGVLDFLGALGVDGKVAVALVPMFAKIEPGSRDELGQIVRIYNEAEKGTRSIERVVISGHSNGEACWGESGKGELPFTDLVALTGLFPGAAGQVRDLMLSGCQTGYESTMDVYKKAFPRLESIWAYAGTSPGTHTGAIGHLKIWETATEGKGAPNLKAARDGVSKTNHGDNVATWTKDEEYVGGSPMTIDEAVEAALAANNTFQGFFVGTSVVTDPSSGPLYDYYNLVHRVLGHRDSDQVDKVKWKVTLDTTFRLRFFLDPLLPRIIEMKGEVLAAGYEAAGLTQPDWRTVSRAQAFAEAMTFYPSIAKAKGDEKTKVQAAYDVLFNGIRELTADWITDSMTAGD